MTVRKIDTFMDQQATELVAMVTDAFKADREELSCDSEQENVQNKSVQVFKDKAERLNFKFKDQGEQK